MMPLILNRRDRHGQNSILNIMDDVTRECLAAIPDTSISGKRVVRELAEIIERRGKPEMIVSPSRGLQANPCRAVDNGTELTCNAVLGWCSAPQDQLALYCPREAPSRQIAPQSPATLRHMKTPRCSRLLNTRQVAYQHKRLWFKLDDNSGAGHRIACAIHQDRTENQIFIEPDSCADIHTDISLKIAHIYNDFAHLNFIEDLLAQQGDLFG